MAVGKDLELIRESQIRAEEHNKNILEHIQNIEVTLLKHDDRITCVEHWQLGLGGAWAVVVGLFLWLQAEIKSKLGI